MADDGRSTYRERYHAIDRHLATVYRTYGLTALRYAIAVVFLWFGALKPIGASPAAQLVADTVFFLDPAWVVPALGIYEVVIGLCFLYKPLTRIGMLLLLPHMVGTFIPVFLLPEVVFQDSLYALTLEGQYIVKNLVLTAAAMVVAGATAEE